MTSMLYFANPSSASTRAAMTSGELGCLLFPRQRLTRPAGAIWAADNGCFSKGWTGEDKWVAWLKRHAYDVESCRFATAPDVVGDSAATLARSVPWLPVLRDLGYPAALVAQDGLEDDHVPWSSIDALFIGGTTLWKLSAAVHELVAAAHREQKYVHMGRVNSGKRWHIAKRLGCASVDGTFLTYAPDHNLGRLRRWDSMNGEVA
jgi:hypothetical protein